MDYVNLGSSGLKVSRICLGTLTFGDPQWRSYVLDENETRPILKRALDLGINFFDTADMYSLGVSEEVVGKILNEYVPRNEIILATKVYYPMSQDPNDRGLSRKHIKESIDRSLRHLKTDYVDLYQIHRWDEEMPIEETLSALDDLIRIGKVRYIGASSMFVWQFVKAQFTAEVNGWQKFISMQNHYNLVYREEEREMIPYCQEGNVGILPWSPLARGFLAGNRSRDGQRITERAKSDTLAEKLYYRDSDFDVLDRVLETANKHHISPVQVSLAWMLTNKYVTAPIVGVRSIDQLDELVDSLKVYLSGEDMEFLEDAYQPHPVLGL